MSDQADWTRRYITPSADGDRRPHIRALLAAGADPRAKTRAGMSPFVLAHRYGLTEVAALLGAVGAAEPLTSSEQFLAACARGDRDAAVTLREQHPDFPASLSADQLAQLPNLAARLAPAMPSS